VNLYSWCPMSNHFHLAFESPNANISLYMQHVLTASARRRLAVVKPSVLCRGQRTFSGCAFHSCGANRFSDDIATARKRFAVLEQTDERPGDGRIFTRSKKAVSSAGMRGWRKRKQSGVNFDASFGARADGPWITIHVPCLTLWPDV
jgi:hypothetical protein